MNSVNASHILVKTENEALGILKKIVSKEITFEEGAKQFSLCPSKRQGGSLGSFERGMMVPEFDEVCFNEKNKVGDITGPIKTQFGFHLIKINSIN
jgi:peptidyl-prolyl cis-trans isomerase C